jgi:ribosomal-protein-alanine N-acetyltransferase
VPQPDLPSKLEVRAISRAEASEAASWRYPPPFDLNDGPPDRVDLYMDSSPGGFGYYSVVTAGTGELVGFSSFGSEARVSGQIPVGGTLDVGFGLRPELVSRGIGAELMRAVLSFGAERFGPARYRVAIASFNERSRRLCESAGFEVVRRFDGPGRDFDELERATDLGA